MVQAGATVISPGTHSTPEDAVLAEKIFSAVGICKNLPEKYLDVVSSLSGAGPAYVSFRCNILPNSFILRMAFVSSGITVSEEAWNHS